MPARLRPADPVVLAAAVRRVREGSAHPDDLRLVTKHSLALLVARAPGAAVEVRVPPYAVAQAVAGTRHTRGTPPAVVETDPTTWVSLALGDLDWSGAVSEGRLVASGERCDLSGYLPLVGPFPDVPDVPDAPDVPDVPDGAGGVGGGGGDPHGGASPPP